MVAMGLLALIAVNLLTAWRFADDKRRAVAGEWRVRESDLLTLAFIGGTPAAFLARSVLRHKTRKQPFSTYLWLIAAMQTGVAISFLF